MIRCILLLAGVVLAGAPRVARAERYALWSLVERMQHEHPAVIAARATLAMRRAQLLEQQLRWTLDGDARFVLAGAPKVDCVPDPGSNCLSTKQVDLVRPEPGPKAAPVDGYQYSFSMWMRQPLFTSGKISSAVGAARGGVGMEQANLAANELDVALTAVRTFVQVKTARSIIDTLETGMGTMRQFLDHVERDRSGPNSFHYSEADVLRLKLQLANTRTWLLEQRRNLLAAEEALHALTADPRADVDMEELQWNDRVVPDVEFWRERMLESRPELLSARAGLRYYGSWRSLQLAWALPDAALVGNMGFGASPSIAQPPLGYANLPAGSPGAGFYAGIRQPLDIGQKIVRWQQVRHEERMQLARFQLGLGWWSLEVDKAWLDFVEAKQRLDENLRAEHVIQGWYAAVNENLALGLYIDGREMVEVMINWMSLRMRRLQALGDSMVALATLRRLSGQRILGPEGSVP
jgi:outer membrane protein TolC